MHKPSAFCLKKRQIANRSGRYAQEPSWRLDRQSGGNAAQKAGEPALGCPLSAQERCQMMKRRAEMPPP
ncbi:hypothetical protein [Azospirillum palustre]